MAAGGPSSGCRPHKPQASAGCRPHKPQAPGGVPPTQAPVQRGRPHTSPSASAGRPAHKPKRDGGVPRTQAPSASAGCPAHKPKRQRGAPHTSPKRQRGCRPHKPQVPRRVPPPQAPGASGVPRTQAPARTRGAAHTSPNAPARGAVPTSPKRHAGCHKPQAPRGVPPTQAQAPRWMGSRVRRRAKGSFWLSAFEPLFLNPSALLPKPGPACFFDARTQFFRLFFRAATAISWDRGHSLAGVSWTMSRRVVIVGAGPVVWRQPCCWPGPAAPSPSSNASPMSAAALPH